MNNKKIRNDIILILSVLLFAAAMFAFYILRAEQGNYVVVTVAGDEIGRYRLSENLKTDILTDNDGINTLVIQDGEVYLSYANCPDKICVQHRKISLAEESIICLPHKLVVSIEKK